MTRFSVVVPAYEAASTLRDTLEAISAQTYEDWDCLVVDDGSRDATLRVASEHASIDGRIRVIHQENQGTAGAYNTGVSTAKGDFIILCSADDVLLPDHMGKMSAFIECEPGYDIYSTNGYFWWPGIRTELWYRCARGSAVHSQDLADVLKTCFMSVGATYRRGLFDRIGGYRLGVYGEDYDFWLRAMASGARHRYLAEAVALHRVSSTRKSAKLEIVYRSDIRIITDLQREFHLSPAEMMTAKASIRERERLIAQLRSRRLRMRQWAKRLAIKILGVDRADRLAWRIRLWAIR